MLAREVGRIEATYDARAREQARPSAFADEGDTARQAGLLLARAAWFEPSFRRCVRGLIREREDGSAGGFVGGGGARSAATSPVAAVEGAAKVGPTRRLVESLDFYKGEWF